MCLEESPQGRRRSSRIKDLQDKRQRERQALVEAQKKAIAFNEIGESNNKNRGKKNVHYVDDNERDLIYENFDILYNSYKRQRTRKSMSIDYLISKTKHIQGGQNTEIGTLKQKRRICELQKRYTNHLPNGKDCLFSQVLNSPQQLIQLEELNGENCRESMFRFVSGLNGKVKSFVSKKLESFNKRDLMIAANPNPEAQNLQFPKNEIISQQPNSPPQTTPHIDPLMLSSPYAPLLSNISLSILSANAVAYQVENETVIDESLFFPPAPFLSNKALCIPGVDETSCPSRNMTAIKGSCKLNDKGKSKIVYGDKNQKACAAAILGNIFLRYDKNGSSSGTKGEASNNESMRGSLLPCRITNDDNAIGIIAKNDGQRGMGDVVDCQARNKINIDQAQFLSPLMPNNALSILSAEVVACRARNVIAADESQFFPPAPLLPHNALNVAGSDVVSCRSRNVTTINGGSKLNDKDNSKMEYEDQNWKACAVAILSSIFLKYDRNGSTSGTKGDSSENARSLLLAGIVNNDNAMGFTGNNSKGKSKSNSFAPGEGTNDDDDCQILFSTNGLTRRNSGERRMPIEVMELSSYVADMPQRAGRPLTEVWPTRVIFRPQPKPLEAITRNTFAAKAKDKILGGSKL